ncbi:MAG: P-loop NTPase fold protein [Crocosphaera sp.]
MDIRQFYRATNPNKTLNIKEEEERQYYVDFSEVRGEEIVGKLKRPIIFPDPNEPSCTLFTGHIGCGKSTELLCLKADLEKDNFFVIYFESDQDLEVTDVDIADILLVIAKQISKGLEEQSIKLYPTGFKKLLQNLGSIFNIKLEGMTLLAIIAEISIKVKEDKSLRQQMNQYLGPQKKELINLINTELIKPAIAQLKEQGKQSLVIIVDNLDRVDNTVKEFGKSQQEYIFIDQAEYLQKLNCHLVYTIPLGLLFSNSYGTLTQRFKDPKVLPMIKTKLRDGSIYEPGIEKLKEMILKRVFPELSNEKRQDNIRAVFQSEESLTKLCLMSGGHVRDLLILLNEWIGEDMEFPLTDKSLGQVIKERRNATTRCISEEEEKMLEEVKVTQRVSDEEGYQKLIRSRFVFEYLDEEGSWYDVNPIINL